VEKKRSRMGRKRKEIRKKVENEKKIMMDYDLWLI
jgi:hypothetical protein